MYETLKKLYNLTKNEKQLTNAVEKGWITAEQKKEIMEG